MGLHGDGPGHGVDGGDGEEGLDRGQPAGGVRLLGGRLQGTEYDPAGVETGPDLVRSGVGHRDVLGLAQTRSRLSLLGRGRG